VGLRVCSVSDTDIALLWGIKRNRSARKTLKKNRSFVAFPSPRKIIRGYYPKMNFYLTNL